MNPREYLLGLGTGDVVHNSGEDFYKHLVAVQEVMRSLGACTDLINAGLFHSIYGTQGFQAFTVPLTQRPEIQKIVGERAELLCYVNCVMDRATLDAALQKDLQTEGFTLEARPEVGGHAIQLSRQQFRDLIAVHLGDWLQQVELEAGMPNEMHGWTKKGDAWGYRRHAYRKMAEILGGSYLSLYKEVFSKETEATKSIHQPFHPTHQPFHPISTQSTVVA